MLITKKDFQFTNLRSQPEITVPILQTPRQLGKTSTLFFCISLPMLKCFVFTLDHYQLEGESFPQSVLKIDWKWRCVSRL